MTEPDFLRTTRTFYDAVAADYAEHFRDALAARPLDRAVLAGFAELVRDADAGPVADLGCGPGKVTAHLAGLGLPVFGVDLSPQMVALARRTHPEVRYEVGAMTDLDLPDGALGGIVAYYSIIHTPQERLPELFAEFHRLLAPGGHALVAFQVGDEPLHVAEPFGHPVSLDFRRRRPDRVAGLLAGAGLEVRTRLLHEPDEGLGESTRQACLIARKPAGTADRHV
ncbi:class I SAM-dependent DNA methyltransferase [Streptomyces nigrescens]|uniref:Methyltransferase n=2 Tax=Streptomyces nigrescens TaxID=1920 RepID=A0A640TQ64_STRNI|nr:MULTISPECIES: class I SAM-dependent methyltransferase [Streptomyces]WAT98720.1 methyltransferase domain-containing protein [Streptomyces libani subsp. libani]WAU06696.1 methyltransferase domain-containing protein [Streptomyces nigrescens]GFE24371.1 methyltransferase [Streptomyces libani subsp. libani]GGV94192.1 methyltransferase [Streptomyces libani subsp. libani]